MNAHRAEREGVPRYTQHPEGVIDVWVDWSGYTAVAVCALCGQTEFAGMDAPSGFAAAFRHRKTHTELADIKTYPHLRKPLCAWGYSEWGAGLRETCDLLPRTGEYCSKHTVRVAKLLERGTCTVEGCWTVQMERQHLCHVHARAWAKEHGYMFDSLGVNGTVTIP